MSRTNSGKLVLDAKSAGSAVGAFNVILLEHAEALVAGAELARLPVILQISENCVNYHKGLKPISVATIAIAESASVPVSVHLDHAESEDLVLLLLVLHSLRDLDAPILAPLKILLSQLLLQK